MKNFINCSMRIKDIGRRYKWLLVIVIVILCNCWVVRLGIVYGPSMEPTLKQHDCIVIWKLGYIPCNGDIVVTDSDNVLNQSIIKRVIATEGQRIQICEGKVYVNGEQLAEKYVEENNNGPSYLPEMIIPKGYVFLMGDNRKQSVDSRTMGCIPIESIMGKVVYTFYRAD